jgi:CTD nuclear envelope phosphatase 1
LKFAGLVKRKTLVLDLDETLIHSHHDGVLRQTVKPGTPPDFILKVTIDRHPVRFFVHKRPHVDFFLEIVSGQTFTNVKPSKS